MDSQLLSSKAYADSLDEITPLYKDLWNESTTMLITTVQSGDRDADILDIAAGLGHETVYVATDGRLRYHKARLKSFDRLMVFTPAYSKGNGDDKRDYADLVIDGIEKIFTTSGITTFIVDSVTRIAALSFGRNASAAYVMKRLVALQMRHGLSLIVIARDATKAVSRSLTALAENTVQLSAGSGEPVVVAANASAVDSTPPSREIDDEPESIDKTLLPLDQDKSVTPLVAERRGVHCRCKALSRRDRRLLRREAQSRKS